MEGFEESVHIVPLGYEFDRAVQPFYRTKVDRIWLVTIDPEKDTGPDAAAKNEKQAYFDLKVADALRSMGIGVTIVRVDMFDVLEVLRCISGLIVREKDQGNRVFVNMSACGRLTSVAATLAAMAHRVTAYYVRADGYAESREAETEHGLSICRGARIRSLEGFRIALPDPVSGLILVELAGSAKGMSADDILTLLRERQVEGFGVDYRCLEYPARRRQQSTYLMRLNKGILSRLERDGHIVRKRAGRYTIIEITESGRYLAAISGAMPIPEGERTECS